MPSDPSASHTTSPIALDPTRRLPPARAPFGTGELSGASDGPLGTAPHFEAGAAAMRAKQAIKAQLFPEQIELAPHIGRFTILRELGRGGMGVVYMAYDETLDRRVAIKLLYDSPDVDREGQARLLREAQSMARLNHPNIAAVYEAGTHEGRVFIAMEFVQGKPLDVWLKERPRPWREVVGVFIQAGRGLHAAHCAGLVHRDFKPANVMLGSDGRVRVLDFGLARGTQVLEPDAELGTFSTMSVVMPILPVTLATPPGPAGVLTREGTIVGTPAYMPPEQFRGEALDPRADQYALCVSLYEGLYGQPPFRGGTLAELWAVVLAGPPRTPPRGTRVPTWLHRILFRGLATDPVHRFPSMITLLSALERRPSRRLRAWLAAVFVVGTILGCVYGIDQYRHAQCNFGEQELAGIWDSDRKTELRAVFERNGAPQSTQAWYTAERILDAHTDRWIAAQRQACKAHQTGQESAALYENRQYCFRKSKSAFIASIEAVTQLNALTSKRVEEATRPLLAMPDCALSRAAAFGATPPPSANEGAVSRYYGELYSIEARRVDGITPALLEESRKLAETAQSVEYAPLLAEALRQRSALEWYSGLHREACASLRESYFLSESVGYDGVAALNAQDVILFCRDFGVKDQDSVDVWVKLALAKLERAELLGGVVHVLVLGNLSLRMMEAERGDDAATYIGKGLAIITEKPAEFSSERPGNGSAFAQILFLATGKYLSKMSEGPRRRALRDALKNAVELVYQGGMNGRAIVQGSSMEELGYLENGNFERARDIAKLTVAALQETAPEDHDSLALALANVSSFSIANESCQAALTPSSAAIDEASVIFGGIGELAALEVGVVAHSTCGDLDVAESLLNRLKVVSGGFDQLGALALEGAGAVYEANAHGDTRAVGMNERALRMCEATMALLVKGSCIGAMNNHAESSLKAGQGEKARGSADKAIVLVEQFWGTSHIALASPLTVLGQIELGAGNAELAIQHLERARRLRERSDPQFRAETEFALARALALQPGKSARAREVGLQALANYEAAGPRRAAEHAKVEAWLATL